jgi:hypothetical protein
MRSVLIASLLVGLAPFQAAAPSVARTPGGTPLDVCWLPALGRVSVSATDATHFSVNVESEGTTRVQEFEIDSMSSNAKLLAAKIGCGPFHGKGILIALSIQDGASTAYEFLISPEVPLQTWTLFTSKLSAGDSGWRLSKEIFRSTGEPYRIVDAHGFSDNFDITFRRGWGAGWPNPNVHEVKFDEKVLFWGCFGVSQMDAEHGGQLCENGVWRTSY